MAQLDLKFRPSKTRQKLIIFENPFSGLYHLQTQSGGRVKISFRALFGG